MYEIKFGPKAHDDLDRLDQQARLRILKKIKWLAENFESLTPEALSGHWAGNYKFRVGDYCAIYTFESKEKQRITIHFVRHRREVYKTK
jgi:mRNA interferase RelE/StbE